MVTAFIAVCFFLFTVGVLPPLPAAVAMTVKEHQDKFEIFGPKYIEFRKIPDERANDKKAAGDELWKIVTANKWNTDHDTSFYLGSLDPKDFKTEDSAPLLTQLDDIFHVQDTEDYFKANHQSLFQDPATRKDKVTGKEKERLDEIGSFIRKKYPSALYMGGRKVAYHYELFNGVYYGNPDGIDERREYVLVMLAFATE